MSKTIEGPPSGHASFGAAVRATILVLFIYVLMPLWGLLFLIPATFSRRVTSWVMKTYVKIVFRVLRWLCGTRCELRGEVPTGPCIVAAKHQSFLDVMMLMLWLPEPRFVMKRSILWAPVLGIYAWRLGCIPIDRSKRGEALRQMIDWIRARGTTAGQVIIFPQGTRVAPDATVPYKAGVVRLYEAFDLPLVLMAVNTGWFWPRTGLRRSPGTAVLEVLETIPPGREPQKLMAEVERKIEAGTARLAQEAARDLHGRE